MSEDIDKIWLEYKKTKSPALKEKLILKYASLVKIVAGRVKMQVGSHVEEDDLISYGLFGLIDAIDKFDYEKGFKFETYASQRIRGEIIDNIRKLDWVPRTLRQKNKILEQVINELEFTFGRAPTEEELAKRLEISVAELKELIKKSSIVSLVSLDDYLEENHEPSNIKAPTNSKIESPENEYEKKEIRKILVDAINNLKEKERLVVTLYYFEELTLKEISKIMGVSESRVSQLHSKAMEKLKLKLEKYKYILFF